MRVRVFSLDTVVDGHGDLGEVVEAVGRGEGGHDAVGEAGRLEDEGRGGMRGEARAYALDLLAQVDRISRRERKDVLAGTEGMSDLDVPVHVG